MAPRVKGGSFLQQYLSSGVEFPPCFLPFLTLFSLSSLLSWPSDIVATPRCSSYDEEEERRKKKKSMVMELVPTLSSQRHYGANSLEHKREGERERMSHQTDRPL